MLIYPFPALLTPFPALVTPFRTTFVIKGNANNRRNRSSFPFPDIAFINEEATGCINEEAIGPINEATIGTIIAPRNLPSCFFISCFTVSVAPSINRLDFFNDSTILIISSLSSFEMNQVNPFPSLTAPFPLIFLLNLSNTEEVASVTNLRKTSLGKKTARSNNIFLPKLPNILPRNQPD